MKSNQDRLYGCLPQTPPEIQYAVQRALQQVHQETAYHPPRRYARRLSFGMVAVIVLLVAAIGVAAGIRFGVFDFMARMFGQADVLPQASELVQNDLATLETEHAVITLSQAVYDGGNLRVIYSVRMKDADAPLSQKELNDASSAFRTALAADHISLWGCDWFYLDGTEYIMTNGSTIETISGMENGEALCYIDIHLASAGIAPQDDFQISLPIIRNGSDDIKTLDFIIKVGDAVPTTYPAHDVNGAAVTVLNTSLSPVRTYVNLRIEKHEDMSAQAFDLLLANWRGAVLVDAQGNKLAPLSQFQVIAEEPGKHAMYSFTFLPTDADAVYIAPIVIDANNNWLVDMTQAQAIE